MRTFVLVIFWMFVIGGLANLMAMVLKEEGRWEKGAIVTFQMPLMLWAAYLLWA